MVTSMTPRRRALGGWARTIGVAGGAIAAYVAVVLLATVLTEDPIAGSAIANVVTLVLAVGYRWCFTGTPLAPEPQPRVRTIDFWVYALAALFVFWVAGQGAGVWVYQVWGSPGLDAVNTARLGSPVWLLLMVALILAPIGEEALIRGIAYPEFRRHWSPLMAGFVTAVIFAALHGNLVQVVLTVPLGVLLALVYEVSKRLWPVIVMHMLFNFASTFTPRHVIEAVATPIFIIPFTALGVVLVSFGMGFRLKTLIGR